MTGKRQACEALCVATRGQLEDGLGGCLQRCRLPRGTSRQATVEAGRVVTLVCVDILSSGFGWGGRRVVGGWGEWRVIVGGWVWADGGESHAPAQSAASRCTRLVRGLVRAWRVRVRVRVRGEGEGDLRV